MNNKSKIRSTCICIKENKVLLIKMRDPLTKEIFWYPPGGKLQSNETPLEAIRREFFEETGTQVKLFSDHYRTVEHEASWAGKSYICISHTFVGELEDENHNFDVRPQKSAYELEIKWVGLSELNEHLGFSKILCDSTRDIILEHISSSQ